LAALTCVLTSLAIAPAVRAEVTKFYDPALSLTGDCTVSTDDSVPDPGCPGGKHPPEGHFEAPKAVTTDSYGNIYVVNSNKSIEGEVGQIDIFDPAGNYISGLAPKGTITDSFGDRAIKNVSRIAVDSTGHLYMSFQTSTDCCSGYAVARYDPTLYVPKSGEIQYGAPPVPVRSYEESTSWNIAVNKSNDHLYVHRYNEIAEYGPPTDGVPNTLIADDIGTGTLAHGSFGTGMMDIDEANDELYVVDRVTDDYSSKVIIRVFSTITPYPLLRTINSSTVPGNSFVTIAVNTGLAVDDRNGHVFVSSPAKKVTYEMDENGIYAGALKTPALESVGGVSTAIDNSAQSPNRGYLYVPSGGSVGRILAYEGLYEPEPPAIEGVSVEGIGEEEATLHAIVNPNSEPADWTFEYVTKQGFEEEGGFGGAAVVAKTGTVTAGDRGVDVSAWLTGLSPGTAYRFRVRVENKCKPEGCATEEVGGFTTFVSPGTEGGNCPNQELRTGASAGLPDCRAYELVTPANTGGLAPFSPAGAPAGPTFVTPTASPAGDSVAFSIQGGLVPAVDGGNGSYNGDNHVSRRTSDGWRTEVLGPNGEQAIWTNPGGLSPDHNYFALQASRQGSLVINGEGTDYVRFPDGSFHLAASGSLATMPAADTKYIAAGGAHMIVVTSATGSTPIPLEPGAPSTGTIAIYDRTADGILHVVSLLPGDVTLPNGHGAIYIGVSGGGSSIAFAVKGGDQLYVRANNGETLEGGAQVPSGVPTACPFNGQLAGSTRTYEWFLDGVPLPGANDESYTPNPSQAGSELQCVVRAQNAQGAAVMAGSPRVIDEVRAQGALPRPLEGVGASGSNLATVPGQTPDCDPRAWTEKPTFTFQWYRDGAPIAGANGEDYEVRPEDAGASLQCRIVAEANGAVTFAYSQALRVTPPPDPAVTNVTDPDAAPQVGDELLCNEGGWQDSPVFAYSWLSNGVSIAGATADTYTLSAGEAGKAVQCQAMVTTTAGTAATVSLPIAISPLTLAELPTGDVTVQGARQVGSTLNCEPGSWNGSPTFSRQWLRDGSPIPSAIDSTYTLTAADLGTVVQCALMATNADASVLAINGGYVGERPQPQAPTLDAKFAGFSEDGRYLFYMREGNLFRFDTDAQVVQALSESGDVVPVNIGTDGTGGYFLSPSVLTSEPNPLGAEPQAGAQNLYHWGGAGFDFVATVTDRDAEGVYAGPGPGYSYDGLGLWMEVSNFRSQILFSSRTSASGDVLLFESRANLTGFDAGGKVELFRFDAAGTTLQCVSCSEAEESPSGDADIAPEFGGQFLFNSRTEIPSLSANGKRAFFETPERLTAADNDGRVDVYEWEAENEGSCERVGGCVFLISSGQSARDNHIFGVSRTGDDVFIVTGDLLTTEDDDEAPSVYDVRVNGGIAPARGPAGECLGEACQPAATAPNDPTPASTSFVGAGNYSADEKAGRRRCPKGKRRVRRGDRPRCVAVKAKKQRKHATNHRRAH
jgi:hypothetical protein